MDSSIWAQNIEFLYKERGPKTQHTRSLQPNFTKEWQRIPIPIPIPRYVRREQHSLWCKSSGLCGLWSGWINRRQSCTLRIGVLESPDGLQRIPVVLGPLASSLAIMPVLHPIAPFNVPHVAMSDTMVAGHFIPKGSHVLLSRIGLGRNPKVWDEPLKFKPERHLGEGCTNVVLTEPDLRFISFSTGRRGCIAASLGTAMTVKLLARLIQGFSWAKSPEASKIDLSESKHDLFLARPLTIRAEPRLPSHLYPSF